MPEWLKGADCKSAGDAYRGSNPLPSTILFQAEIAQLVEHLVANEKVAGSSPVFRSIFMPKIVRILKKLNNSFEYFLKLNKIL